MDCLFCNIVAKKIPADIVFDTADVLAFRDIRPVAPTHVLVVPKAHLSGVDAAQAADAPILGRVLLAARDVAQHLGLPASGYRLVINHGADAGQSVFHLHCHVIGGRPLGWPPG
jgi:histidine triad (HIT) family protein